MLVPECKFPEDNAQKEIYKKWNESEEVNCTWVVCTIKEHLIYIDWTHKQVFDLTETYGKGNEPHGSKIYKYMSYWFMK